MLAKPKKFVKYSLSIDKSNMRQVILDFPKQFKAGFEAAAKIKNQLTKIKNKNINKVMICGMGGSGLPGQLADFLKSKVPISIYKNYGLPASFNSKPLVICISYSGNTEETISAYKEAKKQGLKIISIASAGKLLNLSKKYKTPIAVIPGGIQPRCALGYQSAALIKILENLKLIRNIDREILRAAKNLNPQKLELRGKNLAKRLIGKIPLIYSSWKYRTLAYIWKIKFNENSKIPAFWNYFPELNHNEMVGHTKKSQNFHILILKDSNDHPRILKRMVLTAELLKKSVLAVDFIDLNGKNIWEKIFNNLILADWVSYYLAIFRKIDPTPVEIVEEFKKRLSS